MPDIQTMNHLSVALLLNEIEDVKEITQVFRKLGVIPHFYEDLKSFWHGTLERMPSLAIVDVKKMCEQGLILKNHPSVMNEEMPLLFFYSDKTEPLLVSTQEIFHLGTIKKSNSYEGTFKGLLKRINKVILLEQENYNLKFSVQAQSEEIKKLDEAKSNLVKVDHYQSLAKDICLLLDSKKNAEDFFQAVEQIIEVVGEFDSFSMVELSFNGQKLISPISHVRKFRAIPSLWLGQVCKEGIEVFAQNMATQVAGEILGERVVSVLICGQNSKVDKVIFIKTRDELCFEHFDWNLFESFLNGFYAIFKNREIKAKKDSNYFSSAFEAMSFIDQCTHDSGLKLDYRLVNLNISTISEVLNKNGVQRFYWSKFRDDFISRLEIQSRCEFKFFENSVCDFGFLVQSKDLDYFFDELKEFATKFSFWKYFENNETILFSEIKTKVSMSPMSSFAYLKLVNEKNNDKNMNRSHLDTIKWNRVIENEI